mmetsp:Transcript_15790/g.41598  ORF Transcript_15790/g.41598 Transcript_15790/m.41598 type:complete len:234 (-) Transcript_15790:7-708(-)
MSHHCARPEASRRGAAATGAPGASRRRGGTPSRLARSRPDARPCRRAWRRRGTRPGRARRAWAKRTGGGTPTTATTLWWSAGSASPRASWRAAGRGTTCSPRRRRCRRTSPRTTTSLGATRGCGPPTSRPRTSRGATGRGASARCTASPPSTSRSPGRGTSPTRPASASPRPPSRGWRTTRGPCRCPCRPRTWRGSSRATRRCCRRGSGAASRYGELFAPRVASRGNCKYNSF